MNLTIENGVIVTGQFWNAEFADLINSLEVPTTLVRDDQLMQLNEYHCQFRLGIICKERRTSVDQALVGQMQRIFPALPLVALLGSWCEGESRTGYPLTGVTSIYWHQWQGRFEQLLHATRCGNGMSLEWLARHDGEMPLPKVAVSSLTREGFESIQVALETLGVQPVWLENAAWQADSTGDIAALIIESDMPGEILAKRIGFCRSILPHAPLACTLGFPRKEDVRFLQEQLGVRGILSRPFNLAQLHFLLRDVAGIELPAPNVPPGNQGYGPINLPVNTPSQSMPQLDS